MLTIRWLRAENPKLYRINAAGIDWSLLAEVSSEPGCTMPVQNFGSEVISDDNAIEWGPSIPADNWCTQAAIKGNLTVDLSTSDQLDGMTVYVSSMHAYFTDWAHGNLCVSDYAWAARAGGHAKLHYQRKSATEYHTWYTDDLETTTYWHQKCLVEFKAKKYRSTWYELVNGEWRYMRYDELSYDFYQATLMPVYPESYVENYKRLVSYVWGRYIYDIKPKIKYQTGRWLASLDAVQGFHPYDINMVESLLQFSMEDLVPKRTSSTVLDILTDAVNSKGGLLSPTGLLAAAQIFGNCYLYYKYVALGNFSDVSEITLGTDKPFLGDVVQKIYTADPQFQPKPNVNRKLQSVAQLIVYRGGRALQSYGAWTQALVSSLGDVSTRFNARLQAYPQYLDDMRTADIVLEEFGLSLTWERLAEVVPYEFIAQWFLPIEETIRSVEYNADRLNMMYKVKNLCLSAKTEIALDTPYLCALFNLSSARGDLKLLSYERKSQDKFPPTAPDLSLHPGVSLSRVMQGASLIITRL